MSLMSSPLLVEMVAICNLHIRAAVDDRTAFPGHEARCALGLRAYYKRVEALFALLGVDGDPRLQALSVRAEMADAELLNSEAPTPLLMEHAKRWIAEAIQLMDHESISPFDERALTSVRHVPRPLCELPHKFTEIYSRLANHTCPNTKAFPEEPAICLLCGELLCAGTPCCKLHGRGALTRHVQKCGAGVGLFFFLHRTHTVLLRGPYAAYSISPYVDDHGDEDAGLRRGRPLHLDKDRMKQLADLWAEHNIAREVVHERIMRDRVVREAYY